MSESFGIALSCKMDGTDPTTLYLTTEQHGGQSLQIEMSIEEVDLMHQILGNWLERPEVRRIEWNR